jgi:hypothetical protein
VINIFREMKSKGVVPDVKTFNVFFEMYCALKDETGMIFFELTVLIIIYPHLTR